MHAPSIALVARAVERGLQTPVDSRAAPRLSRVPHVHAAIADILATLVD
jgi:hypothetical protein